MDLNVVSRARCRQMSRVISVLSFWKSVFGGSLHMRWHLDLDLAHSLQTEDIQRSGIDAVVMFSILDHLIQRSQASLRYVGLLVI